MTDTSTTEPSPDAQNAKMRPAVSLSEAAKRAGLSRTAIRRRLDEGQFANAWREDGRQGPMSGPWMIPVVDLQAAGVQLYNEPPPKPQAAESVGERPDGAASVADVEALRAQLRGREEELVMARAAAAKWEAVAQERQAALERSDRAMRVLELAATTGPVGEQSERRGLFASLFSKT